VKNPAEGSPKGDMSGSEGGKAEILPANNANSRELERIQKLICHGFIRVDSRHSRARAALPLMWVVSAMTVENRALLPGFQCPQSFCGVDQSDPAGGIGRQGEAFD
jgi:hypothetical protein